MDDDRLMDEIADYGRGEPEDEEPEASDLDRLAEMVARAKAKPSMWARANVEHKMGEVAAELIAVARAAGQLDVADLSAPLKWEGAEELVSALAALEAKLAEGLR